MFIVESHDPGPALPLKIGAGALGSRCLVGTMKELKIVPHHCIFLLQEKGLVVFSDSDVRINSWHS